MLEKCIVWEKVGTSSSEVWMYVIRRPAGDDFRYD